MKRVILLKAAVVCRTSPCYGATWKLSAAHDDGHAELQADISKEIGCEKAAAFCCKRVDPVGVYHAARIRCADDADGGPPSWPPPSCRA